MKFIEKKYKIQKYKVNQIIFIAAAKGYEEQARYLFVRLNSDQDIKKEFRVLNIGASDDFTDEYNTKNFNPRQVAKLIANSVGEFKNFGIIITGSGYDGGKWGSPYGHLRIVNLESKEGAALARADFAANVATLPAKRNDIMNEAANIVRAFVQTNPNNKGFDLYEQIKLMTHANNPVRLFYYHKLLRNKWPKFIEKYKNKLVQKNL